MTLAGATSGGAPVKGDRLDGWKLIGAYFGRDRTTVIRWARERGLPVHRMPGGRTGTVYALRHELDLWAGIRERDDPAPVDPVSPAPDLAVAARPRRFLSGRHGLLAGAVALLVAATGVHLAPRQSAATSRSTMAMPADPALAARFLAARDLVAERKADGLERAITALDGVTRQSPGFAPGHVALGEALILSREFGKRRDVDAFPRARIAARAAIRLDPGLAAGHRLLGFIAYWTDGDFVEAKARFDQALALDPHDPITHFWYGNILSDRGEHDAALAELDRARLMQPGSVAIRTDLAWARWMRGDDAAAIAELDEIVRNHPDFAVAHDCLAVIAFVAGDLGGYARHTGEVARLRGGAELQVRAKEITDAMAQGKSALHRVILRQAFERSGDGRQERLWAVMVASLPRDRDRVRALLRAADQNDEQWGESGMQSRLRHIWRDDPEMLALILRRGRRSAPRDAAT